MKILPISILTVGILAACKTSQTSDLAGACMSISAQRFSDSYRIAESVDKELGFLRFLRRGWIEDAFSGGNVPARISEQRTASLQAHIKQLKKQAKRLKLSRAARIIEILDVPPGSRGRKYAIALNEADALVQESIAAQAVRFQNIATDFPMPFDELDTAYRQGLSGVDQHLPDMEAPFHDMLRSHLEQRLLHYNSRG